MREIYMTMLIIQNHEELLLLPNWVKQVVNIHCDYPYYPSNKKPIIIELRRHVKGFEVDLIISCKSGERLNRIGFELKEHDWSKAIEQAIKRRDLFQYFYVVLNLPVHAVLGMLRQYPEALDQGIGFISASNNCIVIRSYSKGHVNESVRYKKTILEHLGLDKKEG